MCAICIVMLLEDRLLSGGSHSVVYHISKPLLPGASGSRDPILYTIVSVAIDAFDKVIWLVLKELVDPVLFRSAPSTVLES